MAAPVGRSLADFDRPSTNGRHVAILGMLFSLLGSCAALAQRDPSLPKCDKDWTVREMQSSASIRNLYGRENRSLLQIAAGCNFAEQVSELLFRGAKIEARDRNGDTPLCFAALEGHVDVSDMLLMGGAKVDARCDGGTTALMRASRSGKEDMVRSLIAAGANLDVQDRDGNTALHWAARSNCPRVVYRLIGAGADTKVLNAAGQTALMSAINANAVEAAKEMLQGNIDSKGTALYYAVDINKVTFVKMLVETGSDVNAVDATGRSILLRACEVGNLKVVKILLGARASLEARDGEGRCALHAAVSGGNKEVVQLLLDLKKLDVDDVPPGTSKHYTPLYVAISNRSVEIVRLLLKAGADVNGGASDGERIAHYYTPIVAAASTGDPKIMELILDAGGDLDVKIGGKDLVVYSSLIEKHEMVDFLLKRAKWPRPAATDEAKGARDL